MPRGPSIPIRPRRPIGIMSSNPGGRRMPRPPPIRLPAMKPRRSAIRSRTWTRCESVRTAIAAPRATESFWTSVRRSARSESPSVRRHWISSSPLRLPFGRKESRRVRSRVRIASLRSISVRSIESSLTSCRDVRFNSRRMSMIGPIEFIPGLGPIPIPIPRPPPPPPPPPPTLPRWAGNAAGSVMTSATSTARVWLLIMLVFSREGRTQSVRVHEIVLHSAFAFRLPIRRHGTGVVNPSASPSGCRPQVWAAPVAWAGWAPCRSRGGCSPRPALEHAGPQRTRGRTSPLRD
jgi:hypothetical protein